MYMVCVNNENNLQILNIWGQGGWGNYYTISIHRQTDRQVEEIQARKKSKGLTYLIGVVSTESIKAQVGDLGNSAVLDSEETSGGGGSGCVVCSNSWGISGMSHWVGSRVNGWLSNGQWSGDLSHSWGGIDGGLVVGYWSSGNLSIMSIVSWGSISQRSGDLSNSWGGIDSGLVVSDWGSSDLLSIMSISWAGIDSGVDDTGIVLAD